MLSVLDGFAYSVKQVQHRHEQCLTKNIMRVPDFREILLTTEVFVFKHRMHLYMFPVNNYGVRSSD